MKWNRQIVYTHNMGLGLAKRNKIKEILEFFNKDKPLALMLQEVGVNTEDMNKEEMKKWIDMWMPGYDYWCSIEDNRRRGGVMTLMPRILTPLIIQQDIIKDKEGRFLAIPCHTKTKGQRLWFINIFVQ